MTKPAPDPLRVPCPRCEVTVGEECVTPRGAPAKAHADRVKLAATLAERARLQAEGDAEHRIEGVRWRRLYSSARLELEQRADWSSLAAEQLESLVLNMQAAEEARRKAKGKPTVQGSQGPEQQVANPATAVALRYDAQALATARALRLTPDTRGASAPPLEEVPDDAPDEERDDLAALDELARKRKDRGKAKRARRRAAK